jgi:hypothetical protein
MKSPVVKRSVVVAGHKTSVSLEEAFWNGMKEISGERNVTLSDGWRDRHQAPAGQSIFGDPAVRARLLQEPRRGPVWRAKEAARVVVGAQFGRVLSSKQVVRKASAKVAPARGC